MNTLNCASRRRQVYPPLSSFAIECALRVSVFRNFFHSCFFFFVLLFDALSLRFSCHPEYRQHRIYAMPSADLLLNTPTSIYYSQLAMKYTVRFGLVHNFAIQQIYIVSPRCTNLRNAHIFLHTTYQFLGICLSPHKRCDVDEEDRKKVSHKSQCIKYVEILAMTPARCRHVLVPASLHSPICVSRAHQSSGPTVCLTNERKTKFQSTRSRAARFIM